MDAFGVGDLNPLKWLGKGAAAVAGDAWKTAMIGLWSAGLWLLALAFKIIDVFTTPDLSGHGPLGSVLPIALWIGATIVGVMMAAQLMVALVRRDGQSLARVLLGLGQFGFVWVAYNGIAVGLVAAAAGLEKGILAAGLHVNTMADLNLSASWPREVDDTTLATVLGVLSILLVIPASFAYVMIMFVREAALILLVVTSPISAAGLVNDSSTVWFWKSLRWFVATLLIAPLTALVLVIGVKLSDGVISGAGDQTAAAAGMAVVGTIMVAIGATTPLVLFRLFAFVDPGTASGAALRQSFSDAGGMSGLLSGPSQSGSSAASQSGSDGRSGGEAGAESQTQSRLSRAMSTFGTGIEMATSLAHKASDIGSDVLGQGGVGHPGYSMTPTDQRSSGHSKPDSSGGGGSNPSPDDADPGSTSSGPSTPPPVSGGDSAPSTGGVPDAGGLPAGPGSGAGSGAGGGAGAAGGAGGSEAAIAVIAL